MPLLCGVRKGGALGATVVTGDGLHVMVKRRAQAAGISGPVGFHSLRSGFVTQARRAGADTRAVRRQTHHSSDAMVELYDRDYAPSPARQRCHQPRAVEMELCKVAADATDSRIA